MPGTGTLHHLRAPAQSDRVRVDTGVTEGDSVSIFYDPMISKLICWGEDRPTALRQLGSALAQYQVRDLPNGMQRWSQTSWECCIMFVVF